MQDSRWPLDPANFLFRDAPLDFQGAGGVRKLGSVVNFFFIPGWEVNFFFSALLGVNFFF